MTTLDARPIADTNHNNHEVLLEAEGLKKYFPVTKGLLISKTTGYIKAVDGVSFQIRAGENPRDRGRVWMREEHHGQDAAAARRTHGRNHPLSG